MSCQVTPILREALNRVVDNKIEEYTIEIEDNEMKGENFIGEIIFLSLHHNRTQKSLRLITKKSANVQSEVFRNVYMTEIRFYEQIWPALHEFQQRHSIGFDKIPKIYASIKDEAAEQIILEDLRQYHFRLHDKTTPLDHEHFDLIFRNYGIFHAISFAFRERHPFEFQELTKDLKPMDERIGMGNKRFESVFKANLKASNELFDGEEHAGIKGILDEQSEDPLKYFITKTDESHMTVLGHGDCWSNNFMFKYNDRNEPIDIRILDFQLIAVNSPVKDLSYAFYSGAPKDLLDKLEYYLRVYHETFKITLEKLGCVPKRPLTFEMLKEEWRKYCKYGFYLGLFLLRLKFVDKNHIPSVGDGRDVTSEGRKPALFVIAPDKVGDYNKVVKGLVVHMYENGFF